jgi:Ca2+-dependent lipid-binding protein
MSVYERNFILKPGCQILQFFFGHYNFQNVHLFYINATSNLVFRISALEYKMRERLRRTTVATFR